MITHRCQRWVVRDEAGELTAWEQMVEYDSDCDPVGFWQGMGDAVELEYVGWAEGAITPEQAEDLAQELQLDVSETLVGYRPDEEPVDPTLHMQWSDPTQCVGMTVEEAEEWDERRDGLDGLFALIGADLRITQISDDGEYLDDDGQTITDHHCCDVTETGELDMDVDDNWLHIRQADALANHLKSKKEAGV